MKTIDSLSNSDGLESTIEHVPNKMMANGKIGVTQNGSYSNIALKQQHLHLEISVPSNISVPNDNDRSNHQLDIFEAKDLPAQYQVSILRWGTAPTLAP